MGNSSLVKPNKECPQWQTAYIKLVKRKERKGKRVCLVGFLSIVLLTEFLTLKFAILYTFYTTNGTRRSLYKLCRCLALPITARVR